MNVAGGDMIEIEVVIAGSGLHGVVRTLKAAGYYAAVLGTLGDVMIIYGPRGEHLNTRVPYVALVGDTIRVTDRSTSREQQQNTDR